VLARFGFGAAAQDVRMAKKQPRVPEMRQTKPNREQRRHPGSPPQDEPPARDERAPTALDVPDPRTKTSGHKKKTADNWNQ
jgi:hypothetical protein